jgi:hypothetical protein
MRTERDDLLFMLRMSLHKGMSIVRGMKKVPTEEREKRIAELIINDLENYNWRFFQGQPSGPPG